MCIAAAYALANSVNDVKGCLTEDCILPTMEYENLFIKQAVAVGLKAIEQKIARINFSEEELFAEAKKHIENAKDQTNLLMKKGFIPPFRDNNK